MQKYIAVVHPRMDNDEISKLIAQDIAGALFDISHQNYALAAKLIAQVKELSRRMNRPVSVIQDASAMLDPMDMQFGMRNGIDWVVVSTPEQVRLARKFGKKIPVIWKGKKLPKNLSVDSIMDQSIQDPDATVIGGHHLKHRISPHLKHRIMESIKHIAQHSNASAIAVSDLDEAKSLSSMRPAVKIIFAPRDGELAARASILWGVHPVFSSKNLHSTLKNRQLVRKGERFVDATNSKHVTINSV